MVTLIASFAAGAFVGWNFPQPEWAKRVQETVRDWFKQ